MIRLFYARSDWFDSMAERERVPLWCQATAPAVSCENPTCRFDPDWQPIRRKLAYDTTTACSWPDMDYSGCWFRSGIMESTTLEQCEIMWDTWDRTASSFPAESCVNITKQIRNDFFHVGRCRFAFFSPVLVISTVFPADIIRVVKYGKNWLETRRSSRFDSIPSQSDTHHHSRQTGGREQRQFVWGE